MKLQNLVFWSNSWWIENADAWFISGDEPILYYYNFKDKKCIYVSEIPEDGDDKWRLYSCCIKNGMDIICIPDRANCICIYSLLNKSWKKIEVNNPNQVRLSCIQIEKIDKFLFVYSKGLNQLIVWDLALNKIISYIDLIHDENEALGFGVFYKNSFYVVSSKCFRVYEVNLSSYKITTYDLPMIKDELYTICCYDKKFILSGKKKKIYIWNKSERKFCSIHEIPGSFGEYDFSFTYNQLINYNVGIYKERLFYNSVLVNKCIWFIPFQTNMIMYVDLESNQLRQFEIEDEEETEYTLKHRLLNQKYLFEFVKENRYLGLFSLKNERIIEIDTLKLTYRVLPIMIDDSCKAAFSNKLFYDGRKIDQTMYLLLMEKSNQIREENKEIIGKQIYQRSTIDY